MRQKLSSAITFINFYLAILLLTVASAPAQTPKPSPTPPLPEPVRIVIECEDMQGVAQDKFGPATGWQVGRLGHHLYQNSSFGGVWSSRLRNAMTDAGDNNAQIHADFEVPTNGTYKIWVKYECPPHFNYAFDVIVSPAGSKKQKPVFQKTYGLRDATKHYSFMRKLHTGDLYWPWGIDHDAAEGYEANLKKGKYRLTISKTQNPPPAAARSLDAILITSDLSELSSPRMPRLPLLDELRRANRVFFRFTNPADSTQTGTLSWHRYGHRVMDFYRPSTEHIGLVKTYDEKGNLLPESPKNVLRWTPPLAPGQSSPWYDLGPTLNTETSSALDFRLLPPGAKPKDNSLPLIVDIALEPDAKKILKTFRLEPGEASVAIILQPDLHRPEGVETSKKITDIYRELTQQLNAEPTIGPVPKKLHIFGHTSHISHPFSVDDVPLQMAFRSALGLNTLPHNATGEEVQASIQWARENNFPLIERSLGYSYSNTTENLLKWLDANGTHDQLLYFSYGDEIGLPPVNVNDAPVLERFHQYLKKQNLTPAFFNKNDWSEIKPLLSLSTQVAVQIGVLPENKQTGDDLPPELKRLYWHSSLFQIEEGIRMFAEQTKEVRGLLGDQVHTTANLGGMHPFYWMHQSSFIEAFKHNAMTIAWSEDYTYMMPEASRLSADFLVAYLRKGASYNGQEMMFYCMPHWPGNNPVQLLQNAVLEWGQNVKHLDYFWLGPEAWNTENYTAYRGGLPTLKMVRTINGMAGLLEDHLLPAQTQPAKIAMLLSEASDIWELQGKTQFQVEPGSEATNISQEERKAIWAALRYAGHRVDMLTEWDCIDGLLKNYSVIYICGQNLKRKAAEALRDWVKNGGTLFATAGAARKDEYDEPLDILDEALGRGSQSAYNRYRGPLRARLELLWLQPLDTISTPDGKTLPVYASLEKFQPASQAQILATSTDSSPAFIKNTFGNGTAYYCGFLPGQSFVKAAMPVIPQGKGGCNSLPHMKEYYDWDPTASELILRPLTETGIRPDVIAGHRAVVTNRLSSEKSTIITVVNLAADIEGDLQNLTLQIANLPPIVRSWSCFHKNGLTMQKVDDTSTKITLPRLGPADVIVLEHK